MASQFIAKVSKQTSLQNNPTHVMNCNVMSVRLQTFVRLFLTQTSDLLPLKVWAGTRVATALADGILSCDEERKFWIFWNNNQLNIGSGNIETTFTSLHEFSISFL